MHRPLGSAQRSGGVQFALEAVGGTIVGHEENRRLFTDLEFLEQLNEFSDLPVHHAHERCVNLCGIRPRLVLVGLGRGLVLREVVGGMRRCPRRVTEERPVSILADEFQSSLKHEIL